MNDRKGFKVLKKIFIFFGNKNQGVLTGAALGWIASDFGKRDRRMFSAFSSGRKHTLRSASKT